MQLPRLPLPKCFLNASISFVQHDNWHLVVNFFYSAVGLAFKTLHHKNIREFKTVPKKTTNLPPSWTKVQAQSFFTLQNCQS